ncbi:hypothetical protein DL93DRAFT_2090564 [Clavulina sp. PMI_390]|nr:hypothetical protein DL93DRAFT_2090564 [Clavulina sp. PMI_390]
MFSKTIATALVALSTLSAMITPACARVVGITAPATVTAGTPFPVTLLTSTYIQNIYDYYVVFGIAPLDNTDSGLHTLLGLGVDLIEINEYNTNHGAFNVTLTIPTNWDSSQGNGVNLRAAVFSTVSVALHSLSHPMHPCIHNTLLQYHAK